MTGTIAMALVMTLHNPTCTIESVHQLSAAQLSSKMLLAGSTARIEVDPNELVVTVIPNPQGKYHLYYVYAPGISHSPGLSYGCFEGRLYRLGGFDDPEIREFVKALSLQAHNGSQAAGLARVLIAMLNSDPDHPAIVRGGLTGNTQGMPGAETLSSVSMQDTVVTTADNRVMVRMAAGVSQPAWHEQRKVLLYVFLFDQFGDLQSWAVRDM